ncbi:GreA/GreB family elongation factor [Candidatus Uhrbacteria bacterium]|nr:GreA/GreB family elongation factor [Candidatus Uhrbacteria bacterium]
MQVPHRRSEENKRRDTGSVYLTTEGVQRLQEQLVEFQRGLPAMIQEVMRTKENGDLSENFEYQDAKHTLRRMHGQVASIKARIARAVIITKDATPSTIVQIGSTVVVETAGKRVTYEILGSHESDPAHGRISDRSPLGALLLHRMAGDVVTLTTKIGSREYRIVEVR